MQEISQKLKDNNLKVTPQRLAIYGFLINTTSHPSAEAIYKQLKADYPAMSLATVYKTVDSLTKAHLIQEINVGEDSYRYDADTNFHPHLICTDCLEVFDYHGPLDIKDISKTISDALDFEIENQQLFFYGHCKHCK